MAKALIFLLAYHILFFQSWYRNPFLNSTGEMLSTYFPHWRWMGQSLREGRFPFRDNIYYYYPACIPFLSTFYPPHLLLSLSRLPLDLSFRVFQYFVFSHYFLASVLSYLMFLQWTGPLPAIFGAITLTYSAQMIKVQNPCIVYTVCWIPGILIGGWIGALSLGMAILGGYWPFLIYFLPVVLCASFWHPEILLGFVIGLPQLLTFAWYWPKSIRHKQKVDKKFGKMPLYKLLELFLGDRTGCKVNDVLYTEMSIFCGIAPLVYAGMIFLGGYHHSNMIFFLILSLLGALGVVVPFRGACRWLHLFTFSLTWLTVASLSYVNLNPKVIITLILIQCFLLLRNSKLYPLFPFCEVIRRPSEWIKKNLVLKSLVGNFRVSGMPFPFFTGYYFGNRTVGYNGGFQLQAMADFRGETSPNGSGMHDWFQSDGFGEKMDNYGVRYYFKDGHIGVNPNAKEVDSCILTQLRG